MPNNETKNGFLLPEENDQYNISIFNKNFDKLDKIVTDIYSLVNSKPNDLVTEITKIVKQGLDNKDAPKNASLLDLIKWIDDEVAKEVSLANKYVTKKEFNESLNNYTERIEKLRHQTQEIANLLGGQSYGNNSISEFTDKPENDLINSSKLLLNGKDYQYKLHTNLYDAEKVFNNMTEKTKSVTGESNGMIYVTGTKYTYVSQCDYGFYCSYTKGLGGSGTNKPVVVDKNNHTIKIYSTPTNIEFELINLPKNYFNTNNICNIKIPVIVINTMTIREDYRNHVCIKFTDDDLTSSDIIYLPIEKIGEYDTSASTDTELDIRINYSDIIIDIYNKIKDKIDMTYNLFMNDIKNNPDKFSFSIVFKSDHDFIPTVTFDFDKCQIFNYIKFGIYEKLNDKLYNGRNVYGFYLENDTDNDQVYIWRLDNLLYKNFYTLYGDQFDATLTNNSFTKKNESDSFKFVLKTYWYEDKKPDQPSSYLFSDGHGDLLDYNGYYSTDIWCNELLYTYNKDGIYIWDIEVTIPAHTTRCVTLHVLNSSVYDYDRIKNVLSSFISENDIYPWSWEIDEDKIEKMNDYISDMNKYIFGENSDNLSGDDKNSILDKYYQDANNILTSIKDDVYSHGYNLTEYRKFFNYFDLIVKSIELKLIQYVIFMNSKIRKMIDTSLVLDSSITIETIDCCGTYDSSSRSADVLYSSADGISDSYDKAGLTKVEATDTIYINTNTGKQNHDILKSNVTNFTDVIINTRKGRSLINVEEFNKASNIDNIYKDVRLTLNDFTIFLTSVENGIPKIKAIKIDKSSVEAMGDYDKNKGIIYDSSKLNYILNDENVEYPAVNDKDNKFYTKNNKKYFRVLNFEPCVHKKYHFMYRWATDSEFRKQDNDGTNPQCWVDTMYINLNIVNDTASIKISTYPTSYTIAYAKIYHMVNLDSYYTGDTNVTRIKNDQDNWYNKVEIYYYTNYPKYNIFRYSFKANKNSTDFYLGSLGSRIFYLDSDKNILDKFRVMNIEQDYMDIPNNSIEAYSGYDSYYNIHSNIWKQNGKNIFNLNVFPLNSHMLPAMIDGVLHYVDLSHAIYDITIDNVSFESYDKTHIAEIYDRLFALKLPSINSINRGTNKADSLFGFFDSLILIIYINNSDLDNEILQCHILCPLIDEFDPSKITVIDNINIEFSDSIYIYRFPEKNNTFRSKIPTLKILNSDRDISPTQVRNLNCQYNAAIEHKDYLDMVNYVYNNYGDNLNIMSDGEVSSNSYYTRYDYSDIAHYCEDTGSYYRYDKFNQFDISYKYKTDTEIYTLQSLKNYINDKDSGLGLSDIEYCIFSVGTDDDKLPTKFKNKIVINDKTYDILVNISDNFANKPITNNTLYSYKFISEVKTKFIEAVNTDLKYTLGDGNNIINGDIELFICKTKGKTYIENDDTHDRYNNEIYDSNTIYQFKDEFTEIFPITSKNAFLNSINEATDKIISDINLDESNSTDLIFDSIQDVADGLGVSFEGCEPSSDSNYDKRIGIELDKVFGVKSPTGNIQYYKYTKWKHVGRYTASHIRSRYVFTQSPGYWNTDKERDINFATKDMYVYTNGKEIECSDEEKDHYVFFTTNRDGSYYKSGTKLNDNMKKYSTKSVRVRAFAHSSEDGDNNNIYLINSNKYFNSNERYTGYPYNTVNKNANTLNVCNQESINPKEKSDFSIELKNDDLIWIDRGQYFKNYWGYYIYADVYEFVNTIEEVNESALNPTDVIGNMQNKVHDAFKFPYNTFNTYIYQNAIINNLKNNLDQLIENNVIIKCDINNWISEVFTNIRGSDNSTRKIPSTALFYIPANSKQLNPFFNGVDEYLLKVEYSPIDGETIGKSSKVELTTLVINISAFNNCRVDDIRSKDPFILNGCIDKSTGKYYHSKKIQNVINDINSGQSSISILSPKPMWNKNYYRIGIFDPYPFKYRKIDESSN